MRLNRDQSSFGNFRVATRSSHSSSPPARATFVVERIRRAYFPSLARSVVSVISPTPSNDHEERSSILSSTRESNTFLLSQRNSAPSSECARMGMFGSVSCALRDEARQSKNSTAARLNCSALVRLENRSDLFRMNFPVSERVAN